MSRLWHTDGLTVESRAVFWLSRIRDLTLHFVGRHKELNGGCPDKPSVKSGGEEEEESVEVRVSPSLSQFTFREQNKPAKWKYFPHTNMVFNLSQILKESQGLFVLPGTKFHYFYQIQAPFTHGVVLEIWEKVIIDYWRRKRGRRRDPVDQKWYSLSHQPRNIFNTVLGVIILINEGIL